MDFRRYYSSSLADVTSNSRATEQPSGKLPALWRSLKAKLDALGPSRSTASLSSSPSNTSECASGRASPSLFGDIPLFPAALSTAYSSAGSAHTQQRLSASRQAVQNQSGSPSRMNTVFPNVPRSTSGLPSSLSLSTSGSGPLKTVNINARDRGPGPCKREDIVAEETPKSLDNNITAGLLPSLDVGFKDMEASPSSRPGKLQAEPEPTAKMPSKLLTVSPALPRVMARNTWTLEDYSIVKRLHKGSSSAVYRGTCRCSGMPVALKVYFLSRVPNNMLHMLKREIEIHSQLVHRHIARLYGAFMDEQGRVVLVQEYAPHGDLYDIVQKLGGRMPVHQVADLVMRPFLEALAYLHSRGFCHRDIKPENILFSQSWRLLLADFGVSINLNQERAVTRAGTEGYMAPEVERCPLKAEPEDNKDDPRYAYSTAVDIWAVGVLAYELMVGFPPVVMPGAPKNGAAEVSGFVHSEMTAAALHFPASVPPAARSFVAAALAADPLDRPTAAQLLQHPWLKRQAAVPVTREADGVQGQEDGRLCEQAPFECSSAGPYGRVRPGAGLSSTSPQLEGF